MTDEILIRFSVKDDGSPVIEKVNQKLGETTKQSKALAPGLDNARESLTGFIGENAGLIGVLAGVGLALKSAIDETIAYAMEVKNLSMISGTSADEASRFIQVLDDYELTAEDALAATRKMTENGLVPSIDTLARLADQYNAIQDPMEQNQFVMDNLGRAGVKWVAVLKQGGAALKEQSAALSGGLILTEKQVQAAEEARLAIDGWNDSMDALKTTMGMEMLPWLTRLIDYQTKYTKVVAENKSAIDYLMPGFASLRYTIIALTGAQDETTVSMAKVEQQAELTKKQLKEQADAAAAAAKAISDGIEIQLSAIDKIQQIETDYTKNYRALADERGEAQRNLDKLRAQGYWEQSDQIQSAIAKLDEIKAKEDELTKQKADQTLQFEADMLRQTLARDGWTQGEDEAFQKQMIAWGLWSQDSVDKANAVIERAQATAAAIDAIPSEKVSNIIIQTTYTGASSFSANENVIGNRPHAGGGSFTIPYGGGNESFMLPGGNSASPGETVNIQKAGSESRTDQLLSALLNKKMVDEKVLARAVRDAIITTGR